MNCILYNFSKRKNSTARPSGGTTVSFIYKDASDIHNPVIEFATVDGGNYNYAYVNGVYFFVDKITRPTYQITVLSLSIDVLATYKSNIQSTSAYVLFSSSNYNVDIPDPRIDITANTVMSEDVYSLDGVFNTTDGTYVLQTIGANITGSTGGFATAYAGTKSQINGVSQILTTDQSFWDELRELTLSPYNAIIACYWLPISQSLINGLGSSSDVILGTFNTNISMIKLNTSTINGVASIPIPKAYDDFRNQSPYTTMSVHLPSVGLLDLSTSDLYNSDRLQIEYCIDIMTGDIAYKLTALPGNYMLQTASANIRRNLPIGQNQSDVGGTISGIGSALVGVGGALSGIGSIAAAVAPGLASSVISSNSRAISVSGAYTGVASVILDSALRITAYSKVTSDEPSNTTAPMGRPLGITRSLSGLSGYVQTLNASVSIAGFTRERDSVNSMLNGGIYIE